MPGTVLYKLNLVCHLTPQQLYTRGTIIMDILHVEKSRPAQKGQVTRPDVYTKDLQSESLSSETLLLNHYAIL